MSAFNFPRVYVLAIALLFVLSTGAGASGGAESKVDCEWGLLPVRVGRLTGLGEVDPSGMKPFYMSHELSTLYRWRDNLDRELRDTKRRLETDKDLRASVKKRMKNHESLNDEERDALKKDIEKLLKESEITVLKARVDTVEHRLARLKDSVRGQESIERARLLDLLEQASALPEWRPLLEDHTAASRVARLGKANTVSILSGNPEGSASTAVVDQAVKLATGLKSRGFTVIYDANSATAPILAQALGEQGVGVGGGQLESKPNGFGGLTVRIENDYLRMLAMHAGRRAIVTRDSISGAAMLLNLGADAVLDPTGEWPEKAEDDPLIQWTREINEQKLDLGLNFPGTPRVKKAKALLSQTFRDSEGRKLLVYGMSHYAADDARRARDGLRSPSKKDLSIEQLCEALEYARSMVESRTSLAGTTEGASFFGSATLHDAFNGEIFEAARAYSQLNIPVWTGGAGGFMRVANAGAFAGGGQSVGVPITGRNQLALETRVFSDLQTHTFGVSDYAARLALIVGQKQIVVVVPGRSGTMKEIAVTILRLAANPASKTHVILLDERYYSGLLRVWRSFNLPASVLGNVHLVADAPGLVDVTRSLVQSGQIELGRLRAGGSVTPRELTDGQTEFLRPTNKEDQTTEATP